MSSAAAGARDSLAEVCKAGAFVRTASVFRDKVSAEAGAVYPPEAGRYVLYVSFACPWANRALAVLELKGLTKAVEVAVVAPVWEQTKPGVDEHRGWVFDPAAAKDAPGCTLDPVFGARTIREVYERSDNFNDSVVKFTVPVFFDKKTQRIVCNESSIIIRFLNSEFNAIAEHPEIDLYPESKRAAIDEANERSYEPVNNGVYKCGFATSQAAYNAAFQELQAGLDHFEAVLSSQRWLCGNGPDDLTEADIRLAMTVARFDSCYSIHFKTGGMRLMRERPALIGWLRDVCQYRSGAVGRTISQQHAKLHYYGSHKTLNPYGIVPMGGEIDLSLPHGREGMSR